MLNGQKVWTTLAHVSAFGLIIARTNPDVPKHKGITAFLVDMHAPGVDVRPLYQVTGEAEFNECFFTDVRVPDTMRLGGVGEGWGVSITTLMNERVSIGGNVPPRDSGLIGEALAIWRRQVGGARRRARDGAARRAARAPGCATRSLASPTGAPATCAAPAPRDPRARPRSSPSPRRTSARASSASTCSAPTGCSTSTNYPLIRPTESALASHDMRKAFIRMRANSIEGGTSEVMRNIIGERVLGLPGEPRADKDVAWKDVPRS